MNGKQPIAHRTASERGCPFCAGQGVSVTNSLKTLFPKIAKQWHATKNGKLRPEDVTGRQRQKSMVAVRKISRPRVALQQLALVQERVRAAPNAREPKKLPAS